MENLNEKLIHFATIGKDGKDDSSLLPDSETLDLSAVISFATIGKDGKDDSSLLPGTDDTGLNPVISF